MITFAGNELSTLTLDFSATQAILDSKAGERGELFRPPGETQDAAGAPLHGALPIPTANPRSQECDARPAGATMAPMCAINKTTDLTSRSINTNVKEYQHKRGGRTHGCSRSTNVCKPKRGDE
jgi:hypothetical protein